MPNTQTWTFFHFFSSFSLVQSFRFWPVGSRATPLWGKFGDFGSILLKRERFRLSFIGVIVVFCLGFQLLRLNARLFFSPSFSRLVKQESTGIPMNPFKWAPPQKFNSTVTQSLMQCKPVDLFHLSNGGWVIIAPRLYRFMTVHCYSPFLAKYCSKRLPARVLITTAFKTDQFELTFENNPPLAINFKSSSIDTIRPEYLPNRLFTQFQPIFFAKFQTAIALLDNRIEMAQQNHDDEELRLNDFDWISL